MSCTFLGLSRRETNYFAIVTCCFRLRKNHRTCLVPHRTWAHRCGNMARVLPPGVVGADAERLCAALDRLETLPVVRSAKAEPKPHLGRVICNLWCGAAHVECGERALKQPLVPINKKPSTDAASVPNYLVAAEKLLVKIESQ